MIKREVDFVISVLNGEPVADARLDWYFILGYLELNKISGIFFNRAKLQEVFLPQGVERKLANTLTIQTERNRLMRKYIEDLSDELKFEKVRHAFLKGSILSELIYTKGERISNDIDILIEPKSITPVAKILKIMGFVQGYYDFKKGEIVELPRSEILSRRLNRGETAPFLLKLESAILPFLEIDVNFSLDDLPTGREDLLKEMLDRTVEYKGGLISLSPNDFYLHLILHQYKESTVYSMVKRRKDLELYKFLDLFRFPTETRLDWPIFFDEARWYGMSGEVYAVLRTTSQIFGSIELAERAEEIRPENAESFFEVFDPESKRRFHRTREVLDRLGDYNAADDLEETM